MNDPLPTSNPSEWKPPKKGDTVGFRYCPERRRFVEIVFDGKAVREALKRQRVNHTVKVRSTYAGRKC